MSHQLRRSNRTLLAYSKLEPKNLLATISLVQGELRIIGTLGDDVVRIDVSGDNEAAVNLTVTDGQQQEVFARSDVDSVEFFGLAGDDSLNYQGFSSFDTASLDLLGFYGGLGNDEFTIREDEGRIDEVIAIGGGGDDLLQSDTLQPGESRAAVRFFGGQGNDTLIGSASDDTLEGGLGEDTLSGLAGNDRLFGGGGDDEIDGGFGDDVIQGDSGADDLHGGDRELAPPDDDTPVLSGDDLIFGGNGDDLIDGSDGVDRLFGGLGNDSSFGGPGDDIINSGDGADELFGGPGNDILVGGVGDDLLNGLSGNDFLDGQDGNDRLFGISGSNFLLGGNGDDVLLGGSGFDTVFGGAGIDSLGNSLEDDTDFTEGEDLTNIQLEDFVGLTLDDAVSLAESVDRPSRIIWINGVRQATTAGVVPIRLNFSVEFGVIIAVWTDTGRIAGDFGDES